MEGRPKLNLQKHQSPKISHKYWMRMVFYAVILGVAYLWMHYQRNESPDVASGADIEEVNHVQIEMEDGAKMD